MAQLISAKRMARQTNDGNAGKNAAAAEMREKGEEKNHIHDFSLWDIVSRHARPVPATFLLPPSIPLPRSLPLALG